MLDHVLKNINVNYFPLPVIIEKRRVDSSKEYNQADKKWKLFVI